MLLGTVENCFPFQAPLLKKNPYRQIPKSTNKSNRNHLCLDNMRATDESKESKKS